MSADCDRKRNKIHMSAECDRKRNSYICQQTAMVKDTVTCVSRPRRGIISMCQQTAIGRGTVQCLLTAIGRGISYKCQQTAIRESVTHVSKPR